MSYLLDKKVKRKRFFIIGLGVVFFIILFYFRIGVFNGLAYVTDEFFHPVFVLGSNVGDKFKSIHVFFSSKNSLYAQNQDLESRLSMDQTQMANYNSILADDESLKEILGRKDAKIPMVLAAILAKPNQSPYDTLLIDAGTVQGIKTGDTVFALGDLPIGRVDVVYDNSSKVILFTNPGEKTQAVVSGKDIFLELVGRGGGNFEMIMPKDLILQKGDQVVMPGSNSYALANVETIISDPRSPFTKALLTSPVNVEQLKFVEIEQ